MISFSPISFKAALHVARNMRQADADEIFGLMDYDDPMLVAHSAAKAALGYVARVGDEAVCCTGAYRIRHGVWGVFLFATDRFEEVGNAVSRFWAQRLVPALVGMNVHRVECYSAVGHADAHEFLRRMGASELPAPGMGRSGEDYLCFYWLRRDDAADRVLKKG